MLNVYFYSVFNTSPTPVPSFEEMPIPTATLGSIVEASEVWEVLCALDPNKAQGIDGIGSKILRSCAAALTTPLHHLFQSTLNNHVLPME